MRIIVWLGLLEIQLIGYGRGGQKNPTVAQVNTFLSSQGYRNSGNQNMSQKIYAFGKTSGVTHFSRGLGMGPLAVPIDAK